MQILRPALLSNANANLETRSPLQCEHRLTSCIASHLTSTILKFSRSSRSTFRLPTFLMSLNIPATSANPFEPGLLELAVQQGLRPVWHDRRSSRQAAAPTGVVRVGEDVVDGLRLARVLHLGVYVAQVAVSVGDRDPEILGRGVGLSSQPRRRRRHGLDAQPCPLRSPSPRPPSPQALSSPTPLPPLLLLSPAPGPSPPATHAR